VCELTKELLLSSSVRCFLLLHSSWSITKWRWDICSRLFGHLDDIQRMIPEDVSWLAGGIECARSIMQRELRQVKRANRINWSFFLLLMWIFTFVRKLQLLTFIYFATQRRWLAATVICPHWRIPRDRQTVINVDELKQKPSLHGWVWNETCDIQ
jgi:hypothetical protein